MDDFDKAILREAEALLSVGFCGVWLRPKQKRPYSREWASLPSPSWQTFKSQHQPKANLGIRLGRYSETPCGFAHVIDLDIRDESKKQAAYDALFSLFPQIDFKTAPSVVSGSGGESRHFYVFIDQPFRSKTLAHSGTKFTSEDGKSHFHWEIELFGSGKQVVAPPSIHPNGGKYEWETPLDVAEVELGLYSTLLGETFSENLTLDRKSEAMTTNDDDALLDLANLDPPLGITIEEARELLSILPVDQWVEPREGWLKIGMACHHEFDGSEEGFALWCDISKQSDKFDIEDQRRNWSSFKTSGGSLLTFATIKREVARIGLTFGLAKNAIDAANTYREGVNAVAKHDLQPSEESRLIAELHKLAEREKLDIPIKDIRKDLTAARKSAKNDQAAAALSIEAWLAAETLATFFNGGDHVMYIEGVPWVYSKGVWAPVDKTKISKRVYLLVERVLRRSKSLSAGLADFAAESGRLDRLDNLCTSVSGVLALRQEVSDSDDPLGLTTFTNESFINTRNCELLFVDGTMHEREHDPSHLRTTQVSTEYDADAVCPKWDAMLQRLFIENHDCDEIIRHLHEVLGYLIQSDRSRALWLLFYGTGSNGKSAVASILLALLGVSACASISIPDLSKDNHALAGLVGKSVVIDDDFDKRAILPDGWLKKLSEGKVLTANPKYRKAFNFSGRAAPLILSNHHPKTSDLSHGLARRAQVFHFNTTISSKEADLNLASSIIENELSGVLNRLIAGWLRLQKRGRLLEPESVIEAKRVWLSKRNALSEFLAEALVVTKSDTDRVKGSDLWDSFSAWCVNNNIRNTWGRNTFYSEVQDIPGVGRVPMSGGVVFRGATLKDIILEDEENKIEAFDPLDRF